MPRRSIVLTENEIAYLTWYCHKKGITNGIAGLLSIALHSYIVRNKARGQIAPWDDEEVGADEMMRRYGLRGIRTVRNAARDEDSDEDEG